MSPYEITHPGGGVEHWNEEPGAVWLERAARIYERMVWLNPTPEAYWDASLSTGLIRDIIGPERMFPLTIGGLDRAMRALTK
jgi:uncharacterized protein with von Willebrand factor type A (vWA) domain